VGFGGYLELWEILLTIGCCCKVGEVNFGGGGNGVENVVETLSPPSDNEDDEFVLKLRILPVPLREDCKLGTCEALSIPGGGKT